MTPPPSPNTTSTAMLEAAVALHVQGRLDQAEPIYEKILRAEPQHFDALQLLATIALQRGNSSLAVDLYDSALAIDPRHAGSLSNRGTALLNLKRFTEALASFERALLNAPDYVDAMVNRGTALQALGRYDEAVQSHGRALELRPDHVEALFDRANALCGIGRYLDALQDYAQVLRLKPDHVEAMNGRGIALLRLDRPDEALQSFERALQGREHYWEALNNRGSALIGLMRHEEALECLTRAHELNPGNAETMNNLGNALLGLERHAEALEAFDTACRMKPDYADALYNRGNVLLDLRRHAEALESFERAMQVQPGFAEVMNNRGIALRGLNRMEEALASHEHALELKLDFADAMNNCGIVLLELGRYAQALAYFERTLELKPDFEFLRGIWLDARMKCCDWRGVDGQISDLLKRIGQGEKASSPFSILAISESPALQRTAAEIWTRSRHPRRDVHAPAGKPRTWGKVRLGYFSADFRNHPVSYLTAEMFELHDRSRFELTAFSFGTQAADDTRKRLVAAFDDFIDVRARTDREVVALARERGIDIAIDLGGHTRDSRTGIFAMRAAPVQVSYLGYLGTMGAEYYDYLLADGMIIPAGARCHYAEKIAYLPSYQVNDSRRRISEHRFSREELGLPASGFVYCCFNNNYKINPATFDGWMRILGRVPGSVLFLYADNALAAANLSAEALARGIDAHRLIFGRRLAAPEYLARYRVADLFLDTFPYNAGTTASDALWTGLPVLTLPGETFSSRVAASLLEAIRLPELIVDSQQAYEDLAVALALHPERMMEIRARLAASRNTAPLFDTPLFTRNIEAVYAEMVRRQRAGLPAAHIGAVSV